MPHLIASSDKTPWTKITHEHMSSVFFFNAYWHCSDTVWKIFFTVWNNPSVIFYTKIGAWIFKNTRECSSVFIDEWSTVSQSIKDFPINMYYITSCCTLLQEHVNIEEDGKINATTLTVF